MLLGDSDVEMGISYLEFMIHRDMYFPVATQIPITRAVRVNEETFAENNML